METETLVRSTPSNVIPEAAVPTSELQAVMPGEMRVIRRNGKVTAFDANKISVAITKAFLAVEGGNAAASRRIHDTVAELTAQVAKALQRRFSGGGTMHIEDIQDQVELALMRGEHHRIARSYVLYREEHARLRAEKAKQEPKAEAGEACLHVTLPDGSRKPLDEARLQKVVAEACSGLSDVDGAWIIDEARRGLFDGVPEKDVAATLVMAARTRIEQEPNYSQVAARLLLDSMRHEALGFLGNVGVNATQDDMAEQYPEYFAAYVKRGAELELLSPELTRYDLDRLGAALKPERDLLFTYLGLQTLYDRYFIHSNNVRFELPQAFFMRVAMGLAMNEIDRESRAIEFYNLLSNFDFMSSTPTLFNAGTLRPQLSSCYLTTVPDHLDGIYSAIKDNALLSKYAGGLGNDWTPVRGMGAHIKGTNGKSQGVVPFLKVANDTAVAVNQGGKRKGAVCAYLESWHIDIEEFLDLRKNTGDDRRRTHDMNTANWVPDLFMKRVAEEGQWTLFSPNDVPDLHDLTGAAFDARYQEYEAKVDRGELTLFKRMPASQLWRKMLSMLFETGHPWIAFKDPCNVRYTNQHAGTVHSSNLCTEITLHTNESEIAVCNLGSVNLVNHVSDDGVLDAQKLEKTVSTAMRMLDNVIDINYYSVPQARRSNLRHRPVGLGIMGFQDALYKLRIPYTSDAAVAFADQSMEQVSYYAIKPAPTWPKSAAAIPASTARCGARGYCR
nr:ribonucleoside-diphosphate reductase subunit alpha [Methylogaea oryzae]